MTNQNRRALITGQRGLIGRPLEARLRQEGWELASWSSDIRELPANFPATDTVFHLAGATRHDQFVTARAESFDVNLRGTLAVLRYCQRSGARLVFASTAGVYSPPSSGHPLTEQSPVAPQSDYPLSKWLAEQACQEASRGGGVSVVILRLFNVYGPGQHPSFLVPYVIRCLEDDQPMNLRMPQGERDFVYVDDVVDAFVKASDSRQEGLRVYNIGTGQATRIDEAVRLLAAIYQKAPRTTLGEAHLGEVDSSVADSTGARQGLHWVPETDLESGFRKIRAG